MSDDSFLGFGILCSVNGGPPVLHCMMLVCDEASFFLIMYVTYLSSSFIVYSVGGLFCRCSNNWFNMSDLQYDIPLIFNNLPNKDFVNFSSIGVSGSVVCFLIMCCNACSSMSNVGMVDVAVSVK